MIAKLHDGYEVTINEENLNDWRILKLLRKIEKGSTDLVVDVAELLLGEEQLEALETHLTVGGKIPIDKMVDALREIMEGATELKNS